jgi:hypothetical protein
MDTVHIDKLRYEIQKQEVPSLTGPFRVLHVVIEKVEATVACLNVLSRY